MTNANMITVDGNEACASVAYRLSEVAVIYPITPSSTMGEVADEWAAKNKPNLWGDVPQVVEMQSEGGAAGACHGAIQAGSLGVTFTASQGLLLMIPNMYKIAGELTPFCIHVTARTLATHALSIFGDHSDVMACRQTGFAMLASASVQEAQDMACVSHVASLKSRVPFLHFFDGFRTSHEVSKIVALSDDDLREMVDEDLIAEHRARALTPDAPVVRGTAQNPDTWFQAAEARNPWYSVCPDIVQETMDQFAQVTGRRYKLFDYTGHPQAERVIVIMGSGCETVEQTANYLVEKGEKVGVLKVRLFRPFSVDAFVSALPTSVTSIAVLDRTKEPGSLGEPLFMDVVGALSRVNAKGGQQRNPRVIGGRYGLSSKEFTPAMVKAVFDELTKDDAKPEFTVGINDDLTHLSLAYDPKFSIEPQDVTSCMFFGLGSDGTVGANKNSIKIISESSGLYGQGYFVYDSKKSGGITISHLRFGPNPIQAPYLLQHASFIACHVFEFLEKIDVLELAEEGATLLLNSPFGADKVWEHIPGPVQNQLISKKMRLYVIDANQVAHDVGMGRRINTIMQACFFALAEVLPADEAVTAIKDAIQKTYGRKSQKIVEANFKAVDAAIAHMHEVTIPDQVTGNPCPPVVSPEAPDFVRNITAMMLAGKGDLLPVSAFPADGTWPTATAKWEKRNIALELPEWDESICAQCGKCMMVCPHAAIRAKAVPPETLSDKPELKHVPFKGAGDMKGLEYVIQVTPEDCTGCTLCSVVCPAVSKENPEHKSLNMRPKLDIFDQEKAGWEAFVKLPETSRASIKPNVRATQFAQPLFEFSGACLGCGETPYIKMLTQLWGDRMMVANATGCSSIYGANLPTTPYAVDPAGRGPSWANSLFEDNAEFGLGFRIALDQHRTEIKRLLGNLASKLDGQLVDGLLADMNRTDEEGVAAQRARIEALRAALKPMTDHDARVLETLADYFVDKVVWIVGGDGWAYDIGYGGLDHVLASGRNVNILVMDTEVYSNTGGQQSKATPLGASAKFAVSGKGLPKKDLGLIAMANGQVYVANVAFGSNDNQTIKALAEAVSYDGPSLIIAYSHCIAHGYDLAKGLEQQSAAVGSGYWPLYRFDPRKLAEGQPALAIDNAGGKSSFADYICAEGRYRVTKNQDPEVFGEMVKAAEGDIARRLTLLEYLAGKTPTAPAAE